MPDRRATTRTPSRSDRPSGRPGRPGGPGRLLPVTLDRRLAADLGLVGVESGVAPGPALSEQVPTLVEGHLDVLQAALFLAAQALAGVGVLESVFLVDEIADAGEEIGVVHPSI